MLTCDTYLTPTTLDEALADWARAPAGSRIVAGATDVLPWAREGRAGDVHLPAIVDVSRVAGLGDYEIADGRVRIGAAVAMQRFLTDETLGKHLPSMPQCAVWFADDQIREQATLAGNIINASPAADGTPPMLAMNGAVELARLEDGDVARRLVPLGDFVTGPGSTTIGGGEIATAIICDSMAGYGGAFEKVGQRRSLVISTVCVACLVRPEADSRTFDDVRLSVGGIGPVPVRLTGIEDFLAGAPIEDETVSRAGRMADGIVNSRTRREYRRTVVEGFVERALTDALADCGTAVAAAGAREAAHA